MSIDADWPVRVAAFAALKSLVQVHGPVLAWATIEQGFVFEAKRFRFANQSKGIFRPAGMVDAALSLKTTVPRSGLPKYEDLEKDEAFIYAFQRRGPDYHDNRLLLRAIELQTPLIYFYGIKPGLYRPLWPTYASQISSDQVSLTVEPVDIVLPPGAHLRDAAMHGAVRRYATVEIKKRLHQDIFRTHVLSAYNERCAVCQLPRPELLDAAHIIPDRLERGAPIVTNGIALCKLHHGAYDTHLMGIRADRVIELSDKLMSTHDGATLEYGLKSFNGHTIHVPRESELHPSPEHLQDRYELFLAQAG